MEPSSRSLFASTATSSSFLAERARDLQPRSHSVIVWIAACALLSVALPSGATALESELHGPVNDHAELLTPAEQTELATKLHAFETRSGHQFALLTVKSVQGRSLEDYSMRVVDTWKLGDAARHDGLLFWSLSRNVRFASKLVTDSRAPSLMPWQRGSSGTQPYRRSNEEPTTSQSQAPSRHSSPPPSMAALPLPAGPANTRTAGHIRSSPSRDRVACLPVRTTCRGSRVRHLRLRGELDVKRVPARRRRPSWYDDPYEGDALSAQSDGSGSTRSRVASPTASSSPSGGTSSSASSGSESYSGGGGGFGGGGASGEW